VIDSLGGDHWRELQLGLVEGQLLCGLLLQRSEDSLRLQLVVYCALDQSNDVSNLEPSIEELGRHKHC
tara:strand:- start:7 stop:210 length:204 start_codon:yes stop_codon:yes gene_type:complete